MSLEIKLSKLLDFAKIVCEEQEMPSSDSFYIVMAESFYTVLEEAKNAGSYNDDGLMFTKSPDGFNVTNVNYKRIHAFSYDSDGISTLNSNGEEFEINDLSLREFAYATMFSIMLSGYIESLSSSGSATKLKTRLQHLNLSPMEDDPFQKKKEYLQAQTDLFNYCDGKSVENIEQTLFDYYNALRLLILNLQSPAVDVDTLFGWENLCIIKQEDTFAIVGDFNSYFNIVTMDFDGKATIGVFYKDESMTLPQEVEYNTVKVRALLWMLQYVTESLTTESENHYSSDKVKNTIDQFIEKFLNVDTTFIKPRLPSIPDKVKSETELNEYMIKAKALQGLLGELNVKLEMIEDFHIRNIQNEH